MGFFDGQEVLEECLSNAGYVNSVVRGLGRVFLDWTGDTRGGGIRPPGVFVAHSLTFTSVILVSFYLYSVIIIIKTVKIMSTDSLASEVTIVRCGKVRRGRLAVKKKK